MKITDKKVVQFHYTLKDEAGKELESSKGSDPLAYLHGFNNMLVGVEKALTDKAAGDKFSVTLQPEDAYGERKEDLIQRVPVKHLLGLPSKNAKWKPGMVAVVETEQGQRQVTVIKPGRFMVTVDVNPPLAGKVLTFDLEVIDVRDATDEEVEHGHAHGVGGHHH
ncbi:peptidyl-prolyl cis-trans isomerase [Thalassotalea insulae]|uniref:Peptidyl-prolyl cis-trans isomerase n=1 Tax=Thalassotalea insulae TaxID=2056778 RepID=A0ABQ6GZJ9_9GAMM|nr:peptidylprolyl isomerase [Thalassotalea insulae]GLX80180.1 peptidyl-prolyl cis-trans isomerase [Thalassotalea insulae]